MHQYFLIFLSKMKKDEKYCFKNWGRDSPLTTDRDRNISVLGARQPCIQAAGCKKQKESCLSQRKEWCAIYSSILIKVAYKNVIIKKHINDCIACSLFNFVTFVFSLVVCVCFLACLLFYASLCPLPSAIEQFRPRILHSNWKTVYIWSLSITSKIYSNVDPHVSFIVNTQSILFTYNFGQDLIMI